MGTVSSWAFCPGGSEGMVGFQTSDSPEIPAPTSSTQHQQQPHYFTVGWRLSLNSKACKAVVPTLKFMDEETSSWMRKLRLRVSWLGPGPHTVDQLRRDPGVPSKDSRALLHGANFVTPSLRVLICKVGVISAPTSWGVRTD